MERSCLICVGTENVLRDLISNRKHSGKNDYMKYLFAIPMDISVSESALKLTPEVKHIMPKDEFLHPGYCGEICRDLLINNPEFKGEKDLFSIVGIEEPGCGYDNYDIVFPQGRTDRGENSRDASMREFMEETGIKIDTSRHPTFLGFVGKRKEMSVYCYLAGK